MQNKKQTTYETLLKKNQANLYGSKSSTNNSTKLGSNTSMNGMVKQPVLGGEVPGAARPATVLSGSVSK